MTNTYEKARKPAWMKAFTVFLSTVVVTFIISLFSDFFGNLYFKEIKQLMPYIPKLELGTGIFYN